MSENPIQADNGACCQVFGPGQEEWDAPADEEGDAEAGGDGAPGGLRLGAAQVQGDIPDCPGGLQHCCVPPHHVALLQLLSQVGCSNINWFMIIK